MRRLLLCLALCGCEARFTTLCTEPQCPYAGPVNSDAHDLGAADQMDFQGVVAAGPFSGRSGHSSRGGAELYRRADGSLEVRFAADFSVASAAGSAVFLTSRADMGSSLDAQADVNLGDLKTISGAQSYSVPTSAEVGRRSVFVYCLPLRIEMAKAVLVNP